MSPSPTKDMSYLKPVNVTLLGKRNLCKCNYAKDLEMRLSLIRVLPESNDRCLSRHLQGEDTQKRRCEDRSRACLLQGEEGEGCQQPPEAWRDRHGMHFPPELPEGTSVANTLILDL